MSRYAIFAIWVLTLSCPGSAAAQSDLERARTMYNAGRFDEAIAAATAARGKPAAAASATLIIARARLERFRLSSDPQELAAARKELVSLNPRNLAPQEAIEWQVGAGTALFFENQFGPAAEMFTAVLPSARTRLTQSELERLLEWWGATMSRHGENLAGDPRKNAYERFRSDVRLELERNPLSRPATYWMVVASRGTGDLDAAWDAAVAGWIRADGQPEGQLLRADLERFVTQTLIPERAQARTGERLDAKGTAAEIVSMTEEWRAVTARWGSGE